MKKSKYIILILVALLVIMFPLTINAARINASDYEPSKLTTDDVKSMYQFGGSVAGTIQIIGTIVSAGTMIILGIRYVVASADEKAEYKERMLPYFIGAILLFGTANIVGVIAGMVGNNTEIVTVTKEEFFYDSNYLYCVFCEDKCTRKTIAGPDQYAIAFACDECGVQYHCYKHENKTYVDELNKKMDDKLKNGEITFEQISYMYSPCSACGLYYDITKSRDMNDNWAVCYNCGADGSVFQNEVEPGVYQGIDENFFECESCKEISIKDWNEDKKTYNCKICGGGPYQDKQEEEQKGGNVVDYKDEQKNGYKGFNEQYRFNEETFRCPMCGDGKKTYTNNEKTSFKCANCTDNDIEYSCYKYSEYPNLTGYALCYYCGYWFDDNYMECYHCEGYVEEYYFYNEDGTETLNTILFICPDCNNYVAKKYADDGTYGCPLCENSGFKDSWR